MENVEDKGEVEGEEEEQWLAVEMAEASGELLSTVHMQREQWSMQKMKEKGKRKNNGCSITAKAGGELRELLSMCSVVLYFCSSSSAPLFTVFINIVCNLAQKAT